MDHKTYTLDEVALAEVKSRPALGGTRVRVSRSPCTVRIYAIRAYTRRSWRWAHNAPRCRRAARSGWCLPSQRPAVQTITVAKQGITTVDQAALASGDVSGKLAGRWDRPCGQDTRRSTRHNLSVPRVMATVTATFSVGSPPGGTPTAHWVSTSPDT